MRADDHLTCSLSHRLAHAAQTPGFRTAVSRFPYAFTRDGHVSRHDAATALHVLVAAHDRDLASGLSARAMHHIRGLVLAWAIGIAEERATSAGTPYGSDTRGPRYTAPPGLE